MLHTVSSKGKLDTVFFDFYSLQSGLSRELFEQWCTDRRNGVIIAGYCVEGTLAKVKASTPPLFFDRK